MLLQSRVLIETMSSSSDDNQNDIKASVELLAVIDITHHEITVMGFVSRIRRGPRAFCSISSVPPEIRWLFWVSRHDLCRVCWA